MKTKIIFLDLDGVLNLTRVNTGRDEYGEIFSDHLVDNLRNIIDETGANIVISSTWKSSGLSNILDMWKSRNLPGVVIDITPNEVDIVNSGRAEFYDMVDRGMEIDQWIKNNDFIGTYVILDDIEDFTKDQLEFFIKTDHNIGLTRDQSNLAISILNKKGE